MAKKETYRKAFSRVTDHSVFFRGYFLDDSLIYYILYKSNQTCIDMWLAGMWRYALYKMNGIDCNEKGEFVLVTCKISTLSFCVS